MLRHELDEIAQKQCLLIYPACCVCCADSEKCGSACENTRSGNSSTLKHPFVRFKYQRRSASNGAFCLRASSK